MSADHTPVSASTPIVDTMTDPEGWQGFVSQFFDLPVHYNSSSTSKKKKKKKKKKAPVIVHSESANPEIFAVDKSKKNQTNKVIAAPAPAAAFAGRFTAQYGDNFTSLEPWVKLCRDLGVQGPLNSKTQCKKALRHIHVNIRDFLDAIELRTAAAAYYADSPSLRATILNLPVLVHFFDSEWSLAAYTLANHRVYPRREIRANQEHPLRLLMANIWYPRGGGKARRGVVGC